MVEWYYGYLKFRRIYIPGNNDTYETSIDTGFPQGEVCSASFWAIAYDRAVQILNSRGVSGQVYADDSCALIGGLNIKFMFKRMYQVLMQLELWGMTCGLKFNATKSEVILFSRDNIGKRKFIPPKL